MASAAAATTAKAITAAAENLAIAAPDRSAAAEEKARVWGRWRCGGGDGDGMGGEEEEGLGAFYSGKVSTPLTAWIEICG